MKRKYAAIALGLTLALSSTAAFAEESTEPASVEATADEASTEDLTDTSAENTDTFVGQITEITEDTIKIANSQLIMDAAATESAAEDTAEDATADAAEDTAEDETADAAAEDTAEDETADAAEDTAEDETADAAEDTAEDETADAASTDGAESTGEADEVYAVLEVSPDHTTTINYSDMTSFERLTQPFYLTVADDTILPTQEDSEVPEEAAEGSAADTEAAADENAEASAADTEAAEDENAEKDLQLIQRLLPMKTLKHLRLIQRLLRMKMLRILRTPLK